IPPPRAAISWYVAPLLRSSNSSTRVPLNTGCVCAPPNPGSNTCPRASTTVVSASISASISSEALTLSMRPSRTSMPPLTTIASSRNSGPTRGRAGPASVTTCEQLTTASVLSLFSDDIDPDADNISDHDRNDDLQSKRAKVFHIRNRNDRVTDVDQSNDEAGRTGNLEPPRRFNTKRFHSEKRNRKQDQVRQRVEDAAGIIDQLKRFLRVHTRQAHNADHDSDHAYKQNRVDRRLVLLVQTTKPTRQQSIPARDHRQPRVADEIDAHEGDGPNGDTENRNRPDCANPAERTKPDRKHLWNRSNHVDVIARDKCHH